MLTIRPIRAQDAAAFLELCLTLDEETQFMMLEPGERKTSLQGQEERIARVLQTENHTVIVADAGDRLAGYVEATGGTFGRNRHGAFLVLGVLRAHSGQGTGTRLLQAVEAWARDRGLRRLELTVMTHNAAAVSLYRKMGFAIEGTRRDSLLVSGRYVDEYLMAKILPGIEGRDGRI
jgi:RimJ/RimL family protein N-acetyltransferase